MRILLHSQLVGLFSYLKNKKVNLMKNKHTTFDFKVIDVRIYAVFMITN